MPELPEVESVRRILAPQLAGRRIVSLKVISPDVIIDADAFCREIAGQRIAELSRRGKYLSLWMESGDRMMVHLRMAGCLLCVPAGFLSEKHTHAVFFLDDGMELRFSDTRRFGRIWLIRQGEKEYGGIEKLGPEPYDLSADYLISRCAGSRRSVKTCLMDQSLIAGIGNIYSDEILFAAGISPQRPAVSLDEWEWENLALQIPRCLTYFTEKNAMTAEEYLASGGREYRNTPYLRVYGRGEKPCPVCGSTLEKILISGRSSVFCPSCQR